jgi:site-specific DNA-methyltransferase (adenine-specific)
MKWLKNREENSIHAIVTDPPFAMREYTPEELKKLRKGHGGVWRIPPKIGGSERSPLPRFTELTKEEITSIHKFFKEWGELALKVLVPGGHVIIASNPLVSYVVSHALVSAGFEKRGEIIRIVKTLRGGDRPKGAEKEFKEVSAMPRGSYEPWGLYRKPFKGRLADNLRKWKTGGLRRPSVNKPFRDIIQSRVTPKKEREIAPHPSLKPQEFMRTIVRASLPLGEGIVLDPFMGAGSTIAAAIAVGYNSIGIEIDEKYFKIAKKAIPQLAVLP